MRSHFAAAVTVLAVLALPAGAFDRNELQPGDAAFGTLRVGGTFDEFTMRVVRGSVLSVSVARAGASSLVPVFGLFDDDYVPVAVLATGPASARSAPLFTAQYRIITGGLRGSVGSYRVATSVRPTTKFAFSANEASPSTALTFGAFAGYDATVSIKWKGPAPVTLVSVTGPDGAAVTSAAAPRTTASTFTQAGFHASSTGDCVVVVDPPAGTLKWTVAVQLSGKMPKGATHDFRETAPPERPAVTFPSLGRSPIVAVDGEVGGPNLCILSATGGLPDAAFLDGGGGTGGCSRAVRDAAVPPTKYLIYCTDGYFTDIAGVERDGAGRIARFEAPSIRTPFGSGSAVLSGFTYDASGRPTGWVETRRFDASGRTHELVFTGARYLPNGYCKAFRVTHRLLPDGALRTYDYAPLN